MERNKILYDIKDISDILQISIPTAYKVVKCLNDDLSKKKNKYGDNYYTFGAKIYSKYFVERFYDNKFLKIKQIMEKLEIKEFEAKKIWKKSKKELLEKGYLIIKGRVPEKFLMEKIRVV